MQSKGRAPKPQKTILPTTAELRLLEHREHLPEWLSQPTENLGFSGPNLKCMLQSRTLFYPGSGSDGLPIKNFARPHAIHCFIYSDYTYDYHSPSQVSANLVPRHDSLERPWSPAIRGYHPIWNQVIDPISFYRTSLESLPDYSIFGSRFATESDLPHSEVQNTDILTQIEEQLQDQAFKPADTTWYQKCPFDIAFEKLSPLQQKRFSPAEQFLEVISVLHDRGRRRPEEWNWFRPRFRDSWHGTMLFGAVWAVLERDKRLDDSHGPARIALLQITADSYWCYWLLYGRTRTTPYALVLQDHGFGGNYSTFGGIESPLHALTALTGRPQWLLRGLSATEGWPGYETLPGLFGPCQSSRAFRALEEKVRDFPRRQNRQLMR